LPDATTPMSLLWMIPVTIARQWHGGGYGFVTFDGAEIHLGVEPPSER